MRLSFKPDGIDRRRFRLLPVFLCLFVLLLLMGGAVPAFAGGIGLFVGDSDAYTCIRALNLPNLPDTDIRVFSDRDMERPEFPVFVRQMDVAVVDIMQRQPAEWLLENPDQMKAGVRIYAVRRSGHTQDFLNGGFKMDRKLRAYYDYTSAENLANMIRFIANRDLGMETPYDPPVVPPENALYHPDAPGLFPTLSEYAQWYRSSGHFQKGKLWDLTVIFPTFTLDGKKAAVDALIRAYEKNGINTVTWMREMKGWDKTLMHFISSPPLAGNLGSVTGFAFKFSSMFTVDLLPVLKKANVPVLNAQNLFFTSGEEWLSSPQGISPVGLAFQFSNPEMSGLVEPSVIGVKEKDPVLSREINAFRHTPVAPHVEMLARRAARWHALKRKPNRDKKIFLMYYNHGAGKQNIGASYLNVFRSISRIIERLRQEGYTIEGEFTEETVKDLLLRSGRNIGTWAPDELDELLRGGNAAFIDMADYRKWLAATPAEFQEKVAKDWGAPEKTNIMVKDGRFVIPCIQLGNLILAPQPVRGFDDDPDKLYHSTTLYPHHQYNAFYFWLQEKIRPDAMISLGTHGTHEWLPGKQAGLTWKCPPEVLIGDIPNIYPYIVDDVGEGIQAKRRGRGVIIDHAVPPFKRGGVYEEYATLTALISEYETVSSEKIRAARLERISEMTIRLGLDKDLGLAAVDEEALEKVEHYLLELKTEMIPYGLHTFGVSPSDAALTETAQAMAEKGEKSADFYAEQIRACGPSEMESLIRGLSASYIPPASGNDPIRNPESLPTGKNFYAFDPEKVPSREAWEAGRNAGREIIVAYGQKHDNAYPEQVGVVLWSVETIRDEGINVATALYLMGMKPEWDHRDKVKTVVPIPAGELNRPRIDVLLQMSGLFRDTFPLVALMLDSAVKKAAALTDLDNFIRKHSQQVEKSLIAGGRSPEEARKLSLVRLYSAPPGAYGTKVAKMSGNSGLWEEDDIVAEQGFVKMQSYGYSADLWGKPMESSYRDHLRSVDATVHTISSNLYGTMDNDDVFQYLGGLSMAVRKASGKDPEVFVSMQRTTGQGHVEPLSATLGREMRSRYLNPKWIEGMKKENYAGAREMAEFMENMWGWQVTTPDAVDKSLWEQSYEVYVEDKYGQEIKAFFNRENPWAYQSMTARMLEAVRKEYWQADEKVTKKLAAEYALNVVEKGVACCDHTCNNPMLNQMVVNIISLPGVLSPEMVEKFKVAIEQMAKKPLEQQVTERKAMLEKLRDGLKKSSADAPSESSTKQKAETKEASPDQSAKETAETVEGYKMEDMNKKDDTTEMTSSGIQWAASLFILLIIGLFVWGARRK
ncbi:magnesium chelatase [Desulfonema ishimotonii]|uniref:Magnesium chelatase n=1 Tax=Desulfonema ishimotonii TaxID=45657 RepID=A0A401G024_9BACT|nr:cobaltochelatase subunit CobN [Desulfonema ishimotonii]GBC62547.1 magnesium chelatase [Desulfonema ishimotonii]